MTDKPHKKDTNSAPDVPADNPEGTMERFRDGLRRVLSAKKQSLATPAPKHRMRRTRDHDPK